jgi:hypothetical protein
MGTEDQKRDGTMPDGSLPTGKDAAGKISYWNPEDQSVHKTGKGPKLGEPLSFGKIPEDVRRREMPDEFAWVSNVGSEIYDDPGTLVRFELGEPRATPACTKEELIRQGMAGLYRPNGLKPGGPGS